VSDEAKKALSIVSEALARIATRLLTDERFAQEVKSAFKSR